MRRVALVAAHFVPGTLASVHRSRLWSLHLKEFGWEPVIVTTDSRYYEEELEPDFARLVSPDLKIHRTKALPTKPLRLIGDVGVRAFPWHLKCLVGLARRREIDFCHITIPSNFSAPLGRMLRFFTGLPYGIDYIDPWVHEFPGSRNFGTKAWFSARLAEMMEPWCVRRARLITGINRPYYQEVLDRNPALLERAALGAMPYGGAESDHTSVRSALRPATVFQGSEGKFNLMYAGAMLPAAFTVLDCLLAGLRRLADSSPEIAGRLKLHFIGTGKSPNDPNGHNVLPLAQKHGVDELVNERPHRIGYLDTLSHLEQCSAALVLGSTQPHYSPSKCYQSLLSGKPVLSFLHEASTAAPLMNEVGRGPTLTLTAERLPSPEEVAAALAAVMRIPLSPLSAAARALMEPYSARESARLLASSLDEAMRKHESAK